MHRPHSIHIPLKWRQRLQRARHVIRVVALNLLLAAVLVLLVEFAVRVFNPEITPMGTDESLMEPRVYNNSSAPRPGASGQSCGAQFRVDARGFWQYAAAFDSTKPSWLLLGDSVTMGMGVTPDSTFAGRLAAAADSWNVLNAAWIGYTSTDYRHVAAGLLGDNLTNGHAALNIRRLTLFWCLNDVYANVGVFDTPGHTVRRLSGGLLRFLKLHYYTYQWLKATLFDRAHDHYLHDRRFYDDESAHLRAAVRDVQQIHALARHNRVRFEIVLLPYEYQLRPHHGDRQPQQVLQAALQESGIPVYEATEFLRQRGGASASLYLFGDGIHFSPRGHAALNKYLMQRLCRQADF